MKKNPKTTEPPSRHLSVPMAPNESMDRKLADLTVHGEVVNASLLALFSRGTFGEVNLTEAVASLKATTAEVNAGNLAAGERVLMAQAATLNAMFGELGRRAFVNMGEHMPATETYMRLALKAQAQCRATLETLAAMKNPPVVFAKQANIAGMQQVNNGIPAHAGHMKSPNELLEGIDHGTPELDTGATAGAGRSDPALEAVGAINRPAKRGRKGHGIP